MLTSRWIDFAILATYTFGLVLLALRFARRQTSTESYYVARRSIPSWAMGISLLATLISSVTFIAYPGSAYAGDWSLLVPGLTVLVVLAVAGAVVIPFYRRTVGVSAYEYFGKRFGYSARVYASLMFALGHFTKMGFVFYLLALTVSSMTTWSVDYVIVAVGVITIVYTLTGGIEAVIWADVIQGFLLWLGAFLCLGYLLWLTPGGPAAALHTAWSSGKISLGSTALDPHKPTIIVLALYGFFYYLQRYAADQTVVQRYLVARTDRDALRGILLGSLLCIPVWSMFMLIGSLTWSFYKLNGEVLPAHIAKADQVFPYFLTTRLPVGVTGIFLAALFGAAMANLSADFNSLSAVGVEDFYRRLRPAANDADCLKVGKRLVAAIGVTVMIVALILAHLQGGALSLWYTLSAIVGGGLAGLFLLGFLSKRANRTGAWCGIAASLVFTLWAVLTLGGGKIVNLGRWNYPWHDYLIGVIAHLLVLVVGMAASLIWRSDYQSRA